MIDDTVDDSRVQKIKIHNNNIHIFFNIYSKEQRAKSKEHTDEKEEEDTNKKHRGH